jgi:formate C-acetyltransferase
MTAMLSSLLYMPFEHFTSGALNVTIQPKNFEGENGLDNLSNILSVYFEKGGLQIQLSAVDQQLLLDAQQNPDQHRDLMVRVTGYSAVFVDMCKRAQDDFITRNTF